jgi:hypothetical protein
MVGAAEIVVIPSFELNFSQVHVGDEEESFVG